MDKHLQNIAIAESMGWTRVRVHPKGSGGGSDIPKGELLMWEFNWVPPQFKSDKNYARPIPDFVRDLNSIAEAEKTLTVIQQQRYIFVLRNICTVAGCWPEVATAKQRAQAFLQTFNL